MTAISTLFLIFAFSVWKVPLGLALLLLCAVHLIGVIGNFLKRHLKKRGVSRNVNRVVSVGSVVLLTFLFLGVIAASIIWGGLHFNNEKTVVGNYELYGRIREIYNDPLPLEIEDLADVSAQWSKEANH